MYDIEADMLIVTEYLYIKQEIFQLISHVVQDGLLNRLSFSHPSSIPFLFQLSLFPFLFHLIEASSVFFCFLCSVRTLLSSCLLA